MRLKAQHLIFFTGLFLWAGTFLLAQTEQEFEAELVKTIKRAEQTLKNHAFRSRNINDSLAKTLQAVQALHQSQDYKTAESLLKESVQLASDNLFAELMLGDVLENQRKIAEANEVYVRFLEKSDLYSNLSEATLTPESRHIFSAYIRAKLTARNVTAPQVKSLQELPLMDKLKSKKGTVWLNALAAILPAVTIFGLLFWIMACIFGSDELERSDWFRLITGIYCVFVISYLVWLVHLFTRMPALWRSEEKEIGLLLLTGIVLVIWEHLNYLRKKKERLFSDPAFFPCPKCKKPVQKLYKVCPNCGKELNG